MAVVSNEDMQKPGFELVFGRTLGEARSVWDKFPLVAIMPKP